MFRVWISGHFKNHIGCAINMCIQTLWMPSVLAHWSNLTLCRIIRFNRAASRQRVPKKCILNALHIWLFTDTAELERVHTSRQSKTICTELWKDGDRAYVALSRCETSGWNLHGSFSCAEVVQIDGAQDGLAHTNEEFESEFGIHVQTWSCVANARCLRAAPTGIQTA